MTSNGALDSWSARLYPYPRVEHTPRSDNDPRPWIDDHGIRYSDAQVDKTSKIEKHYHDRENPPN